MLIGCTRMYNVTPTVAELWRELLERASRRADVSLEVIDHPAPARLDALWRRPDMGAVFMCGWPYRRSDPRPQIVAAPVPNSPFCEGPNYCSVMVVRAESRLKTLEDTFGGRIAWTEEGSHSGFNAPRRLLMRHATEGQPLYAESVGPVVTPRASVNAVLEGRADIGPVDSLFFHLLERHESETAAKLRVVARTDCAPVPVLVAARDVPAETVAALGIALEESEHDPHCADLLRDLCLRGFERVADPERYALTERWDAEARAAGYDRPA
ncbi:ABC-type phosphate/phosphonate transport system, substrate-binding protein [Salinihabitans flavidus]|uniref:ABC-type phosphate/phosphonate transport system, substrate-binding protein n=1 Tax=Salinihabitans flavidus TaxID=569882 RepID=A0A1H8UJH1_9RHOB|nr:PhnD/SsuA/transferrin family substrate-binding protein [Salinihabitans flavidus]SEP03369.1 ABC-type phosphate/phosphonate transport system, substrate-binding protein [Salinihabitans flavidus]